MSKPSIFIGSSSEGLSVAQAIQSQLSNDAEVTIWNEGVFGLTKGYMESLETALSDFDFAILVLTPDDLVTSRDVSSFGPRDNVLFELGLFIGRLGRSRTFIVHGSKTGIKMPSDLAGISAATYEVNRSDGNQIAALGPACTKIRLAMRESGPAKKAE